jgi:hypothetical protein
MQGERRWGVLTLVVLDEVGNTEDAAGDEEGEGVAGVDDNEQVEILASWPSRAAAGVDVEADVVVRPEKAGDGHASACA